MSVVKVNPKLFGTCRLCLEDIGQYLIVPKVQEQIKYCFDINVEPFDGLPQLLCNACEDILKKFYETKKKIVEKQNDLINKIDLQTSLWRSQRVYFNHGRTKNGGRSLAKQITEAPKIETQPSQETNVPRLADVISEPSKPTVTKSKQIVLSFSCSRPDQPSQSTLTQNKNHTKKSVSWLSHYKTAFACRLCNYSSNKKHNMLKHTRKCHKSLRAKYENVLKNNCKIKLDKLDKIPNITGVNEIVVISSEKIVQDIDRSYFIIYTPKFVNRPVEKHDKSDISDDDCKATKKRKISNDSNKSKKEDQQRFVHTTDLTKDINNEDCIKIDDSSDNASDTNCKSEQDDCNINNVVTLHKILQTGTTDDHKCKIQNIISICHTKYKKNIDLHKMHRTQQDNPALSKLQLKHKVLSIGRKIINKQGFNCTGLLRYMEHRNLEIVWTPNTSNFNSDTNYVRIMTKLSGNVVDDDDLGWKILPANQILPTLFSDSAMPKICQVFYSDRNAHWKVDTKNKLLNKNPVANPKQLPRKPLVIEKHNEAVTANLNRNCNNTENNLSNSMELSVSEYSMPDISATSVVSQETCANEQSTSAEYKNNETLPSQNNTDNDTELSTGRIKVKPLAELLSKEGLRNRLIVGNRTSSNSVSENKQSELFSCLVQANDIVPSDPIVQPTSYIAPLNHMNITAASHINLIRPIIQPSQVLQTIGNSHISYPVQTILQAVQPSLVTNAMNQNVQLTQVSQTETNKKSTAFSPSTRTEFVIMDTVELPSVKTNSPIQYLESLLQLHNICLLDRTNTESSYLFVCLIRFKVLYKQDTMQEPILLSLSLFCYKNMFCIKVKNMSQENIDITKISASWQWEIIKVFTGEVANKMLQNAQNVNQETYELANKFVSLLKRIKYTKV